MEREACDVSCDSSEEVVGRRECGIWTLVGSEWEGVSGGVGDMWCS
jgi:hypothetical protein